MDNRLPPPPLFNTAERVLCYVPLISSTSTVTLFDCLGWNSPRKYLKDPPGPGPSNTSIFVTILRIETKWYKKNEKGKPEAPFEFHFSILITGKCKHLTLNFYEEIPLK